MQGSGFSAVQIFKWKSRHLSKQRWFKKAKRKAAIERHRQAEINAPLAKNERSRVATFRDLTLRWHALWMGVGMAIDYDSID